MVSPEKTSKSREKKSLDELPVIFEPVHLPEAEDNERIKRLSKQILGCIERTKRERRRAKRARENDPFWKDFDEIFGLKELPV